MRSLSRDRIFWGVRGLVALGQNPKKAQESSKHDISKRTASEAKGTLRGEEAVDVATLRDGWEVHQTKLLKSHRFSGGAKAGLSQRKNMFFLNKKVLDSKGRKQTKHLYEFLNNKQKPGFEKA